MNGVPKTLTDVLSRGWWHLLLRGLVAIAFAILTWFRPGISLTALVLLFGAYALVDGVLAVWTAIAGRKTYDGWWVLLLIGLIGVAVGIMTFMTPGYHRARPALLHRHLGHFSRDSRGLDGYSAAQRDRRRMAAHPGWGRVSRIRRAPPRPTRRRSPRRDHPDCGLRLVDRNYPGPPGIQGAEPRPAGGGRQSLAVSRQPSAVSR